MSLYPKGPQLDWTTLDHSYNSISWKHSTKDAKVLHFFGDELTWEQPRNKWPDTEIWYTYYDKFKQFLIQSKEEVSQIKD